MLLNREEIKKIIPYDDPFLFVDGVEEINENTILGFYFASKDAPFFKGHFVDFKIMPGVLIVEALAQLSSILLRKKIDPSGDFSDKFKIGNSHKNYHFLAYSVRGIQFFKPIFPGERIDLKAEILGLYDGPQDSLIYKVSNIKGQAFVNNDLKTEARLSIAIIEKNKFEEKYARFNS
jgi:3-hydroxyacyl-[acyl-carrier-protein] dehydratase